MFDYSKQKPLHEYSVYLEGARRAAIVVFQEGIILREGRSETPIRSNYVQSVEVLSTTPLLGKVGVQLNYYDMFGNKESTKLQMRLNDAQALKQDLGK